MFTLNKEARVFLQREFIMIRNGFENEGLITYQINFDYNAFETLEKLYFKAIKRNIENRIITIYFDSFCAQD